MWLLRIKSGFCWHEGRSWLLKITGQCHKARPGWLLIADNLYFKWSWDVLSTLADSLWEMVWVSEPRAMGLMGDQYEKQEGGGEKAFCLGGHSPALGKTGLATRCGLMSAAACLLCSALVQFATCTAVSSSRQCNTCWSRQFYVDSSPCIVSLIYNPGYLVGISLSGLIML